MKCSEYLKSKGVKSLRSFSEETGVPESTLKVWYKTKRKLFETLVKGVSFEGVLRGFNTSDFGETNNSCEKFIYLDSINSVLYDNGFDILSTPSEG